MSIMVENVLSLVPIVGVIWFVYWFYTTPKYIPNKEEKEKTRAIYREKLKEKEKKLDECEAKIIQFNISDIGRKYKAVSGIESNDTNQTEARRKLCEKAFDLGANAIINMQFQASTNTSSGGTTSETKISQNIFGTGSTAVTKTPYASSSTTFFYSGTAVILEEDS